MTRFLHGCEALLILSMAAFFVEGTYYMPKLFRDADYTIQNVNRATFAVGSETATEEKQLRSQTKDVHALIEKSGAAMDAATADLAAFQFVTDNLNRSAIAVEALVAHTDSSVNGQVLPQLATDLKTVNGTAQQANVALSSLEEPIRNLTVASAAVAQSTPLVMRNLSVTSTNVSTTSSAMAASGEDVKAVADHWKRVLTKPTTPLKAVIGYIGHWTAVFFGQML